MGNLSMGKITIVEIIFGLVFIVTVYYFNKGVNKDIFNKWLVASYGWIYW